MLNSSIILASALVGSISASPLYRRQSSSQPNVVDAHWDGQCFYPEADDDFDLDDHVGWWYQVAGSLESFTSDCKCVYAEYSENDDGTVRVFNSCERDGQEVTIEGTATEVDEDDDYGDEGVYCVQFPGQPEPECPGPNYVVMHIESENDDDDDDDDNGSSNWAIVGSSIFISFYVLSRSQNPSGSDVNSWIQRAGRIGNDISNVVRVDQSDCSFI